MNNLGLLTIILIGLIGGACQKQATENTKTNATTNTYSNSNQKTEQASGPKGLKAPEPCGWFEKSLGLKTNEYKPNSVEPSKYYCSQAKPLVNNSGIEYRAHGDATTVDEFYLAANISPRNSDKQNSDMHTMLSLAAMEIADKAGGQKLTDEVLAAILSGETADFILPPGDDRSKPQIKTVYVEHIPRDGKMFKYVRHVTMRF